MTESFNLLQNTQNTQTQIIDTSQEPLNANNYLSFEMFNSIEYDSPHLFYCQFDDAPAPFDKWFPVQDIQEPTKGVSTSSLSFGIEEINMLNSYSSISFRVEFLDDDKATLETWIKNWQKSISGSLGAIDYLGFNYIEEILKKFYITKYNYQKEKIYTRCYYVIPSGDMTIPHNDTPTGKTLVQNFASFGMEEI